MRAYANEYLNFAFALLLTLLRRAKAPVALSLWHTVASMAQYNDGGKEMPCHDDIRRIKVCTFTIPGDDVSHDGFRASSVLLRCSPFVHCSPREKLVELTSGGEYSEPPRFLDVAINVAVVEQRQLIQQPQQWSVLSRQPHHEALLPAFPLVRTDLCPHLATCTGRHRPELNQ